MISIPLEDIKTKIKETASISDEEIDAKITAKLEQLSGLISKEGAAHIIANELGIKLFEQVSGKLEIKNILVGMRDVETTGKVTRKSEVRDFVSNGREGKVGSFTIGDETGTIRIVCWGSKADELAKFNEGDIVKVSSGYVRENNGQKEVHLNDKSSLTINPEGIQISAVAESPQPKVERKSIKDLQETTSNAELFGTIVQSFEPRFFEVCPQCGKRAKQVEGNFTCAQHQVVTPDFSYVMNVVLDDGTDTVRMVFFRQQVEQLLNKSRDEILAYQSNIAAFDEVKNDLLGKQIKVTGRATKNAMFERLEFITNYVDSNPDPKEELERLEKAA